MKLRYQVLGEEPHCAICLEWGHQDDEVDHVDGNKANNVRANLRRVHKACHKPKTHAESMRGRG
jgi:5-methylcytosine-specific restriction endonuclease McrA